MWVGNVFGPSCVIMWVGNVFGPSCVIMWVGNMFGPCCVIMWVGKMFGPCCVIMWVGNVFGPSCVITQLGPNTLPTHTMGAKMKQWIHSTYFSRSLKHNYDQTHCPLTQWEPKCNKEFIALAFPDLWNMSRLCRYLAKEERACWCTLIVTFILCLCLVGVLVSIPHCIIRWSEICDFDLYWSYSIVFFCIRCVTYRIVGCYLFWFVIGPNVYWEPVTVCRSFIMRPLLML